jgi:hypothetical protein
MNWDTLGILMAIALITVIGWIVLGILYQILIPLLDFIHDKREMRAWKKRNKKP